MRREDRIRVLDQKILNLERALKNERKAHIALAGAFVKECPDTTALLGRLRAMADHAANGKNLKEQHQVIVAAEQHVARYIEQRAGRPQGLFDPNVGHVSPKDVERLEPPENVQSGLFEPTDVHAERTALDQRTQEKLLELMRTKPALTDDELYLLYQQAGGRQNRSQIRDLRIDLTRRGRIVADRSGEKPAYQPVERELAA